MVKKNVDISKLGSVESAKISVTPVNIQVHAQGTGGNKLIEPVPNYIKSDCERVIEGENNTAIVFGRDRPQSRLSGYGGIGHTQAGSIDIVVGRMGANASSEAYVDPDFQKDAARIHISQKTNVDDNFKTSDGNVGNAKAKSAIAIKADGVRIIAREGIKLVTGTDGFNSQDGTVDAVLGIDLIAGNDGTIAAKPGDPGLQPIVKGRNTEAALSAVADRVSELGGIVSAFIQQQMKFNSAVANHYHNSPFYGNPTTPSSIVASAGSDAQVNMMNDCISGLQKHKSNLVSFKQTYLQPSGAKYISSRHNNTN